MKRIDIRPKDYERGKPANERDVVRIVKKELEKIINELVKVAIDCPEKLIELESRIALLEGQPHEPPVDGIPADVRSRTELVAFAQVVFKQELVSYSDDLRSFARKLRDALAAQYSLIERINDQEERFGYIAPDEKHSDAYYRVDSDEIIDFMIDADSAGIPLERLNYSVNRITPW